MATDQPGPPAREANDFLYKSAVAGAVVSPLVMLLPPRKIDIRFFVLSSAFSLSTNYIVHVHTGQSIYARVQRRVGGLFGSYSLPPEAQRTQQILREQRGREELQRKEGLAKVVDEVWMGGEDKDWQRRRAEEHQKGFAEGKGMTGIIMDQISDVWSGNWRPGSNKDGDGEANTNEAKPPEKKQ